MIGIIAAMPKEFDKLSCLMEEKKTVAYSGRDFVCGKISGKDVVLALCGVGKVFAAVTTEIMCLMFSPECIINIGIAGALDKNLSLCDTVISTSVVQHDMDTSAVGDPKGMVSGVNMIYFPASEILVSAALKEAEKLSIKATTGIVASGDQFVCTKERKDEIVKLFSASVCEMEGAAVGQTAYVNNVPFAVIRAVSDNADENCEIDYNEFCHRAAENSARLVKNLIENLPE